MKVTESEVVHVADLANLELTAKERTRLAQDLNSILDYIDRLNELDTSKVPPMAQAITEGNVMRPDELRESLPHENALQNAPDGDSGFFRVPKVIEK
jgi:aspartyl-tRNA(Asn)/glutamyl-tRNA(Gln) amidotransferase subunit C